MTTRYDLAVLHQGRYLVPVQVGHHWQIHAADCSGRLFDFDDEAADRLFDSSEEAIAAGQKIVNAHNAWQRGWDCCDRGESPPAGASPEFLLGFADRCESQGSPAAPPIAG